MSQPAYELEPLDRADDENVTDEVEVRRAEIEETRCNMASTLDAIKDKLDPQVLADTAKQTVHDVTADVTAQAKQAVHDAVHGAKEATIGRAQDAIGGAVHQVQERVGDAVGTVRHTGENVMDTIRENPIPFALIGLGLGWLFVSSRQRDSRRWENERRYEVDYGRSYRGQPGEFPYYPPSYTAQGGYQSGQYGGYQGGQYPSQQGGPLSQAGDKLGQMAGQVQDKAGQVVDRVQDRAGQVVNRVQDKAGEVASRVQDAAGNMVDRVQGRAGEIRERAGEVVNRAGYQAQRAQYAVQEAITESPMTVAAVAFGLGAMVGLLLPETRAEHRMMGEARDQLVDRAQDVAQDLGQRAQQVARQTLDTAKQGAQTAARDAGLTPENIGQTVASAATASGMSSGGGATQTGTFGDTGMIEDVDETDDITARGTSGTI